jgi:hypothetical protein
VKGQVFERNWHGAEFTWMCNRNVHRAIGRGSFQDKQVPPLRDRSGFEAVGGDVGGGGCDFRDASFGIAVSDGSVRLSCRFGRKCANRQIAAGVLGFVEGAVGEGEDFFIVNVDG